MYKIELSKRAIKDFNLLNMVGFKNHIMKLLYILNDNPFQNPPPYKKLEGYSNRYSRRINKQHRLVYTIIENTIKINSMWTHYE